MVLWRLLLCDIATIVRSHWKLQVEKTFVELSPNFIRDVVAEHKSVTTNPELFADLSSVRNLPHLSYHL